MNGRHEDLPFFTLGNQLKVIRQTHQQTITEVSGAVEVDVDHLNRLEAGVERPTEDVLMLLINYFDIKDDEALNLWQLAGYDKPSDYRENYIESDQQKSVIVMLAFDSRIIYSDGVNIDTNDKGIVLNFTQKNGPSNNGVSLPIARVGMSIEQAQEVVDNIQASIMRHRFQTPNKLLADPKNTSSKKLKPH